MILTSMPSWPGDEEAIRVEGPGEPTVSAKD